jgi:hypothetical protein
MMTQVAGREPALIPGVLVRARGRDWVVLPSQEPDVLLLRPLTGGDEEAIGLFRPIEAGTVAPTAFQPPDPAHGGDATAGLLLRDADTAEAQSKFVRASARYPLCGRGDVNTYAIFAETMRGIMGPTGHAGFIAPTGIATDDTTKFFFQSLMDARVLVSLYDFENRRGLFPGVDSRMKFSLLTLTGRDRPAAQGAEFVFFAQSTDDLRKEVRRFTLAAEDIALLNPNTRTGPIFRSRRDAELTKAIYRRAPVLVKVGPPEENPWGVSFLRMFDMSNDSDLFRTRQQLEADGWTLDGNVFCKGSELYLPLYEGKMVQAFDHRAASVETVLANLKRPGQPRDLSLGEHLDPNCFPKPQYWVECSEAQARLPARHYSIVFKSVTSPTNERTMIAALLPFSGVANSMIVVVPSASCTTLLEVCLLANLNAVALDYIVKQKVGGVNLNYFFVKQFPILAPSTYTARDFDYIVPRVLELVYTAWDMQPFARDLGYDGPPFAWDVERRFRLRCELDAYFFRLYAIARDDVAYIMDTFPIVRRQDEVRFGEYRTKRMILEVYDAL